MSIFHEIYGVYYRIAGKLLGRERLTEQEIRETVQKEGFRDSVLFLPQKLLPQKDGSDWGFFRRTKDDALVPVTKHKPPQILTGLQKRWLRTVLDDPRILLFLTEAERLALLGRLGETKPLFRQSQFRYTDQFSDGDPYEDKSYQQIFRQILTAIRKQSVLAVSYRSGRKNQLYLHCVPLKLEYSEKNDKFRVYCIELRGKRSAGAILLNLGRIRSVRDTGEQREKRLSAETYFQKLRCKEPAVVKVFPERNAVERFLMEFAPYEKRTERNIENGCCTVQLWYDRQDETELLIRLLGFGPVLEILGPPELRRKAAERVQMQCRLLQL